MSCYFNYFCTDFLFIKTVAFLLLGLSISNPLISMQPSSTNLEAPTARNARERHAQEVREAKEKKALARSKRERSTPEERLLKAVHDRKKSNIRSALHKGAYVNTKDTAGLTPLFYAIDKNRIIDSVGIIKFLLNNKASPSLQYGPFGRTLLHYIIIETKKVLDQPADISLRPINRDTLIQRKIRIIKLLLAKAPELVSISDKTGTFPIHAATLSGIKEFVEVLLKNHEHVSSPEGNTLDTPLHKAAEHGYTDIITLLLFYGADPKALNSAEKTPLEWAKLLECDANLEAQKLLTTVKVQQETGLILYSEETSH